LAGCVIEDVFKVSGGRGNSTDVVFDGKHYKYLHHR